MPTTITGTDGVSQVQTGAVESGDLPAGSVLQVVQGSTSNNVATTTSSYVETGLTATITPVSSSSSILVLVNQQMQMERDSDSQFGGLRVLRDGVVVHEPAGNATGPFDLNISASGSTYVRQNMRVSIVFTDAPSSSSSLTYKVEGRPYYDGSDQNGEMQFQTGGQPNATSYITLMEIAG